MTSTRSIRLCLLLILTALPLAGVSAQINIGGNISDGSGGPLLANTVYHVTSGLTVPAGATLTIQEGAVIKVMQVTRITVDGTLNVNGTSGNRAIITRIEDDTAGGDTNGDGAATTPTVASWRGLFFSAATGNGTVNGLDIRYTGQLGNSAIRVYGAGPVILNDCLIRDYSGAGLDCNNVGTPVVSNCIFQDGNRPGKRIPIEAIPGFSNNTAMNNSVFNAWEVDNATVDSSITINADSQMNGGHILTTNMTISTGNTLTLGAGVNFKADSAFVSITVDGSMICNGTAGSKVGLTVLSDDSVGGDTNNDGLSTGSPGDWRGLTIGAGEIGSSFTHTIISFSGNNSRAGVTVNGTSPVFNQCSVTDCGADGVDLSGVSNGATFTNCNFDRNGRSVDRAWLRELDNFSNCTAANNTVSDAPFTANNVIDQDTTLDATNIFGGAVQIGTSISISAGFSLTLNAGVIFKFNLVSLSLGAFGDLFVNGTAGNPVVFTSSTDDAFGGDTNKDGASMGMPGQHRGLTFQASASGSILNHLLVRFPGNLSRPGIELVSADITMTNCIIEDGANVGLNIIGSSAPLVSDCQFDRCLIPIRTSNIDAIPGFSNNSATGNVTYDAIENTDNGLTADVTIGTNNLIGKTLINTNSTTIPVGVQLTLLEDVVIKHTVVSTSLNVFGALVCQGTEFKPVVLTIILDDSFGGDSNQDGAATVPSPGRWRGVSLSPTSGPHLLEYTRIRFAGNNSTAGIFVGTGDLTMTNSAVEECQNTALNFNVGNYSPVIRNCSFDNNLMAMNSMRLTNLKNMRDNTATGNTTSNSPRITTSVVGPDDVVLKRSLIDNVAILTTSVSVGNGGSIRIESGCIFKFSQVSASFNVTGGVTQILGSGLEPVVFTVINDDEFGGDSNLDGASNGSSGQWRGVNTGGAGPAIGQVNHLLIRYAGNLSLPGFTSNSNNFALSSIRVEHSGVQGITLSGAFGDVDNLIAFDCTNGIDINGGSFNLRHATVTGCSGIGIDLAAAFTGLVQNSISYGNGTNFVGTTAANLFSSDGDPALAGLNGNLDADPMFVDATPAVGDLRLDAASPCVGTADFFVSLFVGSDHVDSTRVADCDLDGFALSDMGAFEKAPYVMVFAGDPVSGDTMFFAMLGPIGIGFLYVGLEDGLPFFFNPYGLYLAGDANNPFFEFEVDANFGYPLTFPPEPTLVGTRFAVQMVGAVAGNLGVGSFTNAYHGIIQD